MSCKSAATLALSAALLLFATSSQAANASDLRISGAATVANRIIVPNKAAIEQATGATLNITVNGDGNGLKDLYTGKTDIAMTAAPIKASEAALNKANPGSINVAEFELVPLGTTSINFVINPANPVKSLTAAQLKDILTGKITSWKEVGGADQPIVVVAEVPGLGTHTSVVATFLDGTEITSKARTVQALVQIVQVVAQIPTGIGYGNAASITDAVTVIPGVTVAQPLGLATKGPRSAEVNKLIAAVTKYAADK